MAPKFPLSIDLYDNNCTVFGGSLEAFGYVELLSIFGAKITVISQELCPELIVLSEKKAIRYIPRKYFRGDCSTSYLCIAATDNEAVNISISDECKAKSIAVFVHGNEAFGTFDFPSVVNFNDVTLTIQCENKRMNDYLLKSLNQLLPILIRRSDT